MGCEPHCGAIVHPEPGATLAPRARRLIDHIPLQQIMQHEAPGTTAAQHLLKAIEHLPHRVFAGFPHFFRQEQRCQALPLLITQIVCIGRALGCMGVSPHHGRAEDTTP
jgi:hypothetical protein